MKAIFKSTNIDMVRKKYRVIVGLLILVIAGLIYYILLNYNYLAFKHFITGFYSYDEALDDLYEQRLDILNAGEHGYYQNFDNLVISLVSEKIGETAGDRYTNLYLPNQYKKLKETVKAEAGESSVEIISPATAYIKLTNFSDESGKIFKDSIETLKAYDNLIIDLQDNRGGDIDVFHDLANLFLEKDSVMAYEQTRIGFFDRMVTAKSGQKLTFDHIYILQNKQTASSSEGFIMALKENLDYVTVVGEASFGKGVGQYTLPLRKGYAVRATILQLSGPDGHSIHKVGISPDVAVDGDVLAAVVSLYGL